MSTSNTLTKNDLEAVIGKLVSNRDEEIQELLARPYIVEQGTSGNWIYRKWSDGIAECWGRQGGNIPSGWSPDNMMIVTPPINFTEITSWQIGQTNHQVERVYLTFINANTMQVNTKSDDAILANFTICLYGKWK